MALTLYDAKDTVLAIASEGNFKVDDDGNFICNFYVVGLGTGLYTRSTIA
jgi:hypothetical protein